MSNIESSLQKDLVFNRNYTASNDANAHAKDFIGAGFEMTPGNGLGVTVSAGSADINGRYLKTTATTALTAPTRGVSLPYIQAPADQFATAPTFGQVIGTYPAADANTVGRWVIDGTTPIANSAVGNGLAVANNLVKTGTVTQVDGWIGYAGRGDGSTGYYASANATGFPTGANPREVGIVYTHYNKAAIQCIWGYGATGSSQAYAMQVLANNQIQIILGDNDHATNYFVEYGKTYYIVFAYNGYHIKVYINGVCVFTSVNVTANTALTNGMNVGRSWWAGEYMCGVVHFVELRNKLRTPAQIAQASNAMLLPCTYDKISASYPTISTADLASAYHEWKFDETSGTTVADSKGTLNGTATGSPIVDSALGLGKARRFSGVATTDFISVGTVDFKPGMTVIAVVTPALPASGRIFGATTVNTVLFSTSYDGTVGVSFFNGSTWANSGLLPNVGVPNFIAFTVEATTTTFNVNGEVVVSSIAFPTVKSLPAWIGKANDGYCPFKGDIGYLAFIPRSLTPFEVEQYRKALMNTVKTDVREVLPDNAISLGFLNGGSASIVDMDTSSYKYGRRNGATGGNRRIMTEWKYFTTSVNKYFSNPLGTDKITGVELWWKKNLGDNRHSVIRPMYENGVYGSYIQSISADCFNVKSGNINVCWGWNAYTTADEVNGYLAVVAEVME